MAPDGSRYVRKSHYYLWLGDHYDSVAFQHTGEAQQEPPQTVLADCSVLPLVK